MTTKPSEGKFTVPVTGFYQISCQTMRIEKTGNKVAIKNPRYKWYRFWVDKTIIVDEIKTVFDNSGEQMKLLNAGDIIDNNPIGRL